MGTQDLRIGDLTLDKGFVREGVTLFAWDGVQECDPQICPVDHRCTYDKGGKCSVQMTYLKALYKAILGTYSYLDDAMLFKIGMQIIPLYVTLTKMQMLEMSLQSPMVASKNGVMAHPVYKEIRETLKTIHTMWKDLDLSFSFGGKVDPNKGKPTPVEGTTDTGDVERGDPEYYKKLQGSIISRKGVVR
jgi:hypothetical protein